MESPAEHVFQSGTDRPRTLSRAPRRAGPRRTEVARPSRGRDLRALLLLVGFPYWFIAMGSLYLGWSVAAREIFPDLRLLAAVIVVGPLATSATFAYNDSRDWKGDVHNPRKRDGAILRRLITPRTAAVLALALAVASAVGALLLSPELFQAILAIHLLSLLYSGPGPRFKAYPGFDLAVNVVGIGIVLPLAGWGLAGTGEQFPVHYLPATMLPIAALYVPTVMSDHDFDRKAGVRSLAVYFGNRTTGRLGVLFVGAGALANVLVAIGWGDPIPGRVIKLVWPFFILQILGASHLLRPDPPEPRKLLGCILLLAITYMGMVAVFLVDRSGRWLVPFP